MENCSPIDYIAKIKAPKNCYFCKFVDTETGDEEFAPNPPFFVCNRPDDDYSTISQKTGDVVSFEKNMKYYKKCYKPIDQIAVNWFKTVKVILT